MPRGIQAFVKAPPGENIERFCENLAKISTCLSGTVFGEFNTIDIHADVDTTPQQLLDQYVEGMRRARERKKKTA